jgi:methionyl-tRNA formyltransferase
MQILVFTAKWIGLKCIEYMLEKFPEDDYTFIVCEPDADIIIEMLERNGHAYMRLGEDALNVINNVEAKHYDWLLNLWGGHIFKENTLSRAIDTLNIHPAYLPYCRGRDPIVWAIRKGFPAGVTLHKITEGVDEGPIWYREEVPYSFPISGADLYASVVNRCWKVFCKEWSSLRDGKVLATPQPLLDVHTFRRSELLLDRRIDIDSDNASREVISKLLAHDFSSDYTAQILVSGKIYNAKLTLFPVTEENSHT